ncbi:hypothetical protein HT031_000710 [Scenedesmus sp. PABB004]|nr:hypothetical protein HT031_000710 [Scenedesmus sp. PABB004]
MTMRAGPAGAPGARARRQQPTAPARPGPRPSSLPRPLAARVTAQAPPQPAPGGQRAGRDGGGVVARFKQQGAPGDVEQELEYLRLEFDATELLDLHGRDSYLLCDITKAHEHMRGLPLPEGYSADVADGRRELLDYAKEQAVLAEGRVAPPRGRGVDVPVQLLPSALALLAQLDQNAAVRDLATKLLDNWDMRKTFKRDIILSLAVSRCNAARDLLADQKARRALGARWAAPRRAARADTRADTPGAAPQVADGCLVLEEAQAMLAAAGEPPLAPGLASDIQAAVDGLVVQRILDQLRGPMAPESAPARRKAVAMLRDLLGRGAPPRRALGGGGGLMASFAAAAAADGGAGAGALPAGSGVNGDYVRLVVDCMASHEIVAMAPWDAVARCAAATPWLYPGLLQVAATAHLARGFKERRPEHVRTAAALLRAVPVSCEVLLLRGVASVLLGDPAAAVESIKAAARAPPDAAISWPADARAPGPADSDDEPDLVAATRLPAGPDAAAFLARHSAPGEPEMLSGLCLFTEVFMAKVVFAGFPDTSGLRPGAASLPRYFDSPEVAAGLEEDLERGAGLAGRLSALAGAVAGVQPLVQQIAASAASAGSRLGLQVRGGGGAPGAGAGGRSVAARLAADMEPGAAGFEDGDEEAWDAPHALERADGAAGLVGRVRGALQARLGPRWPVALAAAAALGAVALGAGLSRRGAAPAPAPAAHAVARGERAAAARALDRGGAARLVKRFQEAKAAALGSSFDASKLPGVCIGPALAQFTDMSAEWAAQGWFRASHVWKVDVTRLAPRSSSGQRVTVTARIGETSNTWGVDGQAGNAWSNEYDVDYDVVLCSDMAWRIQGLTVRGQEPGKPGGWFGGGGK